MGVLESRLGALADRGAAECAALWVEVQAPDPALEFLGLRNDPVSRLQEAARLLDRADGARAGAILESLSDLPRGLEGVRREMTERAARLVGEPSLPSEETQARRAVPAAELDQWLARVRSWREHLGV